MKDKIIPIFIVVVAIALAGWLIISVRQFGDHIGRNNSILYYSEAQLLNEGAVKVIFDTDINSPSIGYQAPKFLHISESYGNLPDRFERADAHEYVDYIQEISHEISAAIYNLDYDKYNHNEEGVIKDQQTILDAKDSLYRAIMRFDEYTIRKQKELRSQ